MNPDHTDTWFVNLVHIHVIWCSLLDIGTDFSCYLGFNVVSLL